MHSEWLSSFFKGPALFLRPVVSQPCFPHKCPFRRRDFGFCSNMTGDLILVRIILVWVAIIEHHKLGNLNNMCLFLMILESGKSKIMVPAYLVSGKGPLSGERDRSSLSSLSLIRALIPSQGRHPDDLTFSQQPQGQIPSHWD